MDRRFIRYFAVVTAVLATAVYLTTQAAQHDGVVLTVFAVVFAAIGILGFTVLARVVVIVERRSRRR